MPWSTPPVLAAVRAMGQRIGGVWPAWISCLGLLVLLEVLQILFTKDLKIHGYELSGHDSGLGLGNKVESDPLLHTYDSI